MNQKATRDGFGKALTEIAAKDRNVFALDCDLGRSTRSFNITEVDKFRFIDMGIAEQDMLSTAAGMAKMGKVVFVNSFAVFVTGRAFDQIRQQISLSGLNVKICGSSAGITQGADGATHQSVLDVGIMRMLPGLTIISPADYKQAQQAVYSAYKHTGPVYLRLSRFQTGNFLPENVLFEQGKGQIIKKGDDVLLASYGPVLTNVIKAAKILETLGINAGIINFHTLKPIDKTALKMCINSFNFIFSIEEHSIYGGLSTIIAEYMASETTLSNKAALISIGIRDTFGESGTADELLAHHGLDPEGISSKVMETINESNDL